MFVANSGPTLNKGKQSNQSHLQTINRKITSKVRRETLEGVEHLVVPMVMLTEGVHAGSNGPLYYPPEELEKTPVVWNHKPVVVYHPTMAGNAISACDVDVINTHKVGVIMGAEYKDGKLKAEAWLREDQLKKVDGRILEAIQKGEPMEVSTGLFTDNDAEEGEWNGEKYTAIARNYRPDHLAILPDQKGACSLEDGAGLLMNTAGTNLPFDQVYRAVQCVHHILTNEMSHNDMAQKLQALLPAKRRTPAGNYVSMGWVVDIFDTYFVYSDDTKYYRQDYKRDGDNVSLSGTPVEVFRSTTYKTADGKLLGNTRKERAMDKKTKVDQLISNTSTVWEEDDREHLMTMSEERLAGLLEANQACPSDLTEAEKKKWDAMSADERTEWLKSRKTPAKGKVPPQFAKNDDDTPPATEEEGEPSVPPTAEEYIAQAPPGVREMLADGLVAHNAEKARLIAGITANKACKFTKEQLGSKPLSELRLLGELAIQKKAPTANYAGQADTQDPTTNQNEEPLVAPTMNFDK